MNTIRELKQQEKYKSMLKRKNKEKKIYKDKNASLQFEKQKLYRVLLNREKEIERLKRRLEEYQEYVEINHKEIERLKEREKMLQESFSDWKKGIEKERKYWLCERTDCCGRIKDSKKYSSLYQENKRLNNKLKDIKSQLDYLETYSSKEDVFEDMKGRLDRINKIIGSDKE